MSTPEPSDADILILDANPETLRLSTNILLQKGYRVRSVKSLAEAQSAVASEIPTLLLVDDSSKEMSLLEDCRWLKSDEGTAQIPILFISGSLDADEKIAALHKGAADFISKPYAAEELLLRVSLHHKLCHQQKVLREQFARKEAVTLEQLHKSNMELRKLHAAVEQNPASVIITDAQGNIEYVNLKFSEISGYSREEVQGKNPRMFRTPETKAETYTELWGTITQGRIWRGLLCNLCKDGRRIWERTSIAPVRDSETSAITHYIAVKEDITGQREIESQLNQAQKMEAIGRLAAGIAHEINTPTQFVSDNIYFLKGAFNDLLTLLSTYRRFVASVANTGVEEAILFEIRETETATDIDYVSANGPGAFESSLEGLKRIASIVRAMKEFSHPDQREMAPANLNAALENTLTIARNEYKYVADVEKSFTDLPPVLCHIGDLGQVFLNLLVNAAHAIGDVMQKTGKRGIIKVRTFMDPGFVRIEIEDSGTGIPEPARRHVFEPFFTTKEVGKGTGQGLAIAHNVVVKQHKGTLTFESEIGKGTTFIIRLPIIEPVTDEEESPLFSLAEGIFKNSGSGPE